MLCREDGKMRKEGFQTILLMENCILDRAVRWVLVRGVLGRVALGLLDRGVLRVLNKGVGIHTG